MSIRSLADFNGVVPRCVRRLARTDTVTPGGHPRVDQVNEAGTFNGHTRGLSHGHGQSDRRPVSWRRRASRTSRPKARAAGAGAVEALVMLRTATSLPGLRRPGAGDAAESGWVLAVGRFTLQPDMP